MEGQNVPPAGGPQKVRNPKPRTRNATKQGEQPTVRESNPRRPQEQNPSYNHGAEYGNADPAHAYSEQYADGTGDQYDYGTGDQRDYETGDQRGYGTGEHYDYKQGHGQEGYAHEGYVHGTSDQHDYGTGDQHGYVTGEQHDYGTGEHYNYGQGHGQEGYGHEGYGHEGYGHEGYGHEGYGHEGYGHEGYGHEGYGHEAEYGHGAEMNAAPAYGNVAPVPKGKTKKPRNPKHGADGSTHHGAHDDGYGSALHGADGGHAEPYPAAAPEYPQPPLRDPPKRESKHRKPKRSTSMESGTPGAGEGSLASRPEGDGSALSSGSNRSKPDRNDRNVTADGSRHHRSSRRAEQEGSGREGSSGRSNPDRRKHKHENAAPDALREHIRKEQERKPSYQPPVSMMAVLDPRDQPTLVSGTTQPARVSLGEWMEQQGNKGVPEASMEVQLDDQDLKNSELETHFFGKALSNSNPPGKRAPPAKLTPVEEQWDHHGRELQVGAQPMQQQRRYANANPNMNAHAHANPLYLEAQHGQHADAGAVREYRTDPNKQQIVEPNAKCMECVHGVGVPLARLATRIACRQCSQCCCTIL